MRAIGIMWAQYGPYHFARFAALKRLTGGLKLHALELANRTSLYQWDRPKEPAELVTLFPGAEAESLPVGRLFFRARKAFAKLQLDVCILPGYAPKQSLATLLAAKSLKIRTVMMNESHAGTARAGGLGLLFKRQLVRMFDSALVGGEAQKRYLVSMGLATNKIFTGYDAVENSYFDRRAREVQSYDSNFRADYGLPDSYFLSLGRFVAKKNLDTLVRAYHAFLQNSPLRQTHLVMVGAGEEEARLKSLCREVGLSVYEKADAGGKGLGISNHKSQVAHENPGVHFYGFRQVDENPVFYSLADAFILPSLREEWGLVVNEAMASGLPVAVSKTAGCVEDLLGANSPDRGCCKGTNQAQALGMTLHQRQNGFVFDPNSVNELSRILFSLESSSEMRKSMGQASRRIVEKFSCEHFAKNALLAIDAALPSSFGARSCQAELEVQS